MIKSLQRVRNTVTIVLVVSISVTLGTAIAQGAHYKKTKIFRGAWFSVQYPSSFRAQADQPSTSASGAESATFTSPDQAVQFYVFSPQWKGTSTYCQIDAKHEILETQHSEKKSKDGQTTEIHWVTVRARNGQYERSWLDTVTSNNTRLVFGIRYRNAATLAKYQSQYRAFKSSLQQFAD